MFLMPDLLNLGIFRSTPSVPPLIDDGTTGPSGNMYC